MADTVTYLGPPDNIPNTATDAATAAKPAKLKDNGDGTYTLYVEVQAVPSHAVTNAGTFAVQANQAGDDVASSVTATIAGGQSLSPAVDLGAGMMIVGFSVPAGWTTAAVSLQDCATTDGTFEVVRRSDATELSTSALAASQRVCVGDEFGNYHGVRRYVKVQSGTNAAAVEQAGGDIVTILTAPRR